MIYNGGDLGEDAPALMEHIKQAKAIEAKQLESCAIYFMNYTHDCLAYHKPMDGEKEFEQYYFETYGQV